MYSLRNNEIAFSALEDLILLFESGEFSDITIIVNNDSKKDKTIIKAHKAILAARNSVLQEMLRKSSRNSKCSILEISGVNGQSFKIFIEYLYGRTIEEQDITVDLYQIAKKYDDFILSYYCKIHFCDNMTKNNVVPLLNFSLEIKNKQLKQKALHYIAQNFENIKKQDDFQSLLAKQEISKLIMEHLHALSKKIIFPKNTRTYVFKVTDIRDDACHKIWVEGDIKFEISIALYEEAFGKFFFYINVTGDDNQVIFYTAKLLTSNKMKEPIEKSRYSDCSDYFLEWAEFVEPANGYIKNNKFTIEMDIDSLYYLPS